MEICDYVGGPVISDETPSHHPLLRHAYATLRLTVHFSPIHSTLLLFSIYSLLFILFFASSFLSIVIFFFTSPILFSGSTGWVYTTFAYYILSRSS